MPTVKKPAKNTTDTVNNEAVEDSFQDRVNSINKDFMNTVINAETSRRLIARQMELDTRRDIDDECGYASTSDLDPEQYKRLFEREAIATRVVEVLPRESWKVQPNVKEDEDSDTTTEFEDAWQEIANSLDENTWFKSKETNPIWEYLIRADVLSGIGRFGIILLGVDDGKDLKEPLEAKKDMKLLYLRTFDESLIEITQYETDWNDHRYGEPTKYKVTFSDPNVDAQSGAGIPLSSKEVHWTRVVHIADNLGSSEIFGAPRMRPVFNRLVDLRKLYGGSAEMYWRGAFPGVSIETHPQLGGDVVIDSVGMKRQMEDYMNGLQRYLSLVGQTANSLAPQVVDPTPQITTQIEAICIVLGIPKRVFMGSERGELSSGQDSDTWNDRLIFRQTNYLTPRLVAKFINRLIWLGILPEPKEYEILWPALDSMSEQEQAIVAVSKTEAMSKYVTGSVESLMVPFDYLTRVVGFTEDETTAIVEAAEEHEEELELEKAEEREEQLKMAEELGVPQAPTVEGYQPVPPQPIPGQPLPPAPKKSKLPIKNVFEDLRASITE